MSFLKLLGQKLFDYMSLISSLLCLTSLIFGVQNALIMKILNFKLFTILGRKARRLSTYKRILFFTEPLSIKKSFSTFALILDVKFQMWLVNCPNFMILSKINFIVFSIFKYFNHFKA